MRTVNRFEANLLRLLQFFLRCVPPEQALTLVQNRCPVPKCLSRDAVELVQDTLAKGCVLVLARSGGWRRERFLRDGQAAEGRLWQRTSPAQLQLAFSRHTLQFLIWVTATKPGDKEPEWSPAMKELTPADQLLLGLAYGAVRTSEMGKALRARPAILANGLCRLAFAEDFTEAPEKPALDFAPWTAGCRAGILEAWQSDLAAHWLDVERSKRRVSDWPTMRALGQSQEGTLGRFLDAVEAAGRLDLARFLLPVAAGLLSEQAASEDWIAGLPRPGPRIADRLATYRAALAVLRQMERLAKWQQRARSIGYFDEGYAASQLWKTDWDRLGGDALVTRAEKIVRQIEPLTT